MRGTSNAVKKLTQGQRQRLCFIESRLLWEGALQRRDICEAFDLTPNHVTREITAYRRQHKDNLVYDPEVRVWRIGPRFSAAFATGDADEYLTMLHTYALSGDQSVMLSTGPAVPAETLPQVVGKVDRAILREVIGALRRGTGVFVKYQSFSDPEPTERTLWPHALVFANNRWHVRAYDCRKERFGDFVLARILKAHPAQPDGSPQPVAQDQGWQTTVTFEVIPTPTLSPSQQGVVAREFGMRQHGKGASWKVTLRRCLAPYFLHAHRLDLAAKNAPYRRIALRDPKIARDHTFVED